MHGELKTWKEHIKTNFQGQDVSIECTDAESLQCNMVSDSDDDERFLEVPWTYSNLKRQFFVT